jgi:hypothetical protein
MQRRIVLAAVILGAACLVKAGVAQQTAPLEEVVREAASHSTLAEAGGVPFHLKATISEPKNHDPQWDATVEEWWESPTMWKREFHSAAFSQSLIVNGSKVKETDEGPVFPELLRNLTVELVNTVPRLDQLAALHQTVQKPDGTAGQIRGRWTIPGTDGTTMKNIAASIAVSKQTGLMIYGGDIDWDVSLHDFADFHDKKIARRLTAQSQGGPTLQAQITLLEDLTPDKKMFAIHGATAAKKQLRVVVVPEMEMRKLAVSTPAPHWPDVAKGKTSGAMVMRVVIDRTGQVRSVDDYFSDNPALMKPAQEQIMQWRFKPYKDHGAPVQVITTMTFPFSVGLAAGAKP